MYFLKDPKIFHYNIGKTYLFQNGKNYPNRLSDFWDCLESSHTLSLYYLYKETLKETARPDVV